MSPELIQLGIAMVFAGAVSGLLAGLFGIGGGAVMVPVLYEVFGFIGVDDSVRMHVAVASSIAIIVPTSLRSFMSHLKRGAVDTELLKGWVAVVPAGSVAAAVVAAFISGAAMKGVFAVLALLVGLRMIFNRQDLRLGDEVPGNPARALIGGAIGFFSTLMGVGGGVMNNTFMTLYGRPIREAVATSSGVGVLISIPAMLGYAFSGWGAAGVPPFSVGFISLPAIAAIIPVSVIAAPLGVKLAHALPARALEIAFGCFLLFVAARFALSLL